MMGVGEETKEKALESLKEKFENYKTSNSKLPRPGTRVPVQIQLASYKQTVKYSDIEEDFFNKVLRDFITGILFMSDDSTLSVYEPFDPELAI